jgi:arylsulfatase A-like enzyme
MKSFFKTGFGILAGCAVVALLHGALQFSSAQVFLRREVMGFMVLDSWAAASPVFLVLLLLSKRLKDPSHTAFWLGLGIGACPLLMAWLPTPMQFLAGAVLAAIGLLPFSTRLTPPPAVRMGLALLCAALLAASPFLPSSAKSLTPNTYSAADDPRALPQGIDIFLVSIDTLRADVLTDDQNTPGDSTAPLPFLNRKREDSLWAQYALSSSNQTLPGHVGMLTGMDAMEHGVRSNSDFPDPSVPLVSEYFQDAGWNTAAVVSNALISSATDMHRGFDVFSAKPVGLGVYAEMMATTTGPHTWFGMWTTPESAMRLFAYVFARDMIKIKKIPGAERVQSVALEQLDDFYASPRPFFYFIHMLDPHVAYSPPKSIRGQLSKDAAAAVPKRFLPDPTVKLSFQMVRDLERAYQNGELSAATAAATFKYFRLVYMEEMIQVDLSLAQIFARADASGRPYAVLFTGDHGEQFGEHSLMEHANSMYRKNLEVPFMIWGAGVTPGEIVDTTPLLCDVPPTLLHLAGLDIPETLQGRSMLLPPITRPHVVTDNRELAVYNGSGLKWVGRWPDRGDEGQNADDGPLPVALYDLRNDPGEEHNLLEADPLAAQSLLPLIAEFIERDTWSRRQDGVIKSAYQMAAFSELGYAGQDDSATPESTQ